MNITRRNCLRAAGLSGGGLLAGMAGPAAASGIQSGNVDSAVLGEQRRYSVWLPSGYETSQDRYPVLFLLDEPRHFSYVVDLVRVLAEEKSQDISVDVRAPATVRGDSVSLRQALTNLLDNAIRYTPVHGRIILSVGRGPGGKPTVEVEDDGPGIAAEDRERIFDRFYRQERP